jgi:plastocyanin
MAFSARFRLRFLLLLALAPACATAATVKVQVQDAAGRPLPDAVVFLESPEAAAAVKPTAAAEIAQVNQQFLPMVNVVAVGTSVQFPNRDTVRHHVYSFSPTKTFEIKLYAGKPANPVLFDRPGIAVLGCNIHDKMTGWVVVVETPYYGRAGGDGQVELNNVAPGTYHLRTWAAQLPPGAPAADQALTVSAAGGASVRVQLGVAAGS